MKLSKLIIKLKENLEKYGDIELRVGYMHDCVYNILNTLKQRQKEGD
jgi:hypothetical protein